VDNYQKSYPRLSPEELANIIYTALNFEWRSGSSYFYNAATFTLMLDKLLKDYKLDPKIGFATNKYGSRKRDVLTENDLVYMVAVNNATQYFFPPSRFRIPGEIPGGLQGEPARTFVFQKISSITINYIPRVSIDGFWNETIILPESLAEENANITKMKVSFNPEDKQQIDIERQSSWSGNFKNDVQPQIVLFEDWDEEMRNYLHITENYIEELGQKRRTRKLISQVSGTFEKKREEHTKTMKLEIEMYHGIAPEYMKDYSFSSFGVTQANPKLEYKISYTMNGFVRNAGENIILDVGKLIGKQWNPTENERNRNVDAYLPTRRMFENEITIKIPQDYTVGDIEHLNMNFSNKYAAFESVCMIENNTIVIKTKKTYKHTFIPKEEWNKLMTIVDYTNEFYTNSIVFKKKQPELQ